MLDQGRSYTLTKDNAQGVAHPQYGGRHGPLTVRKPVLGHFCRDPGDEGTGDSGDALSNDRHPVLIILWDLLVEAGEGADAAEEAADGSEVGPDPDTGAEPPGLDEVGGHEACGHPRCVADGGDQVKLLARHVIIRRSL